MRRTRRGEDLLAWRDARLERAEIAYWRTATGEEVHFVVESDGKLLPLEVKSGSRPRLGDAANLLSFRAEYGRKSRAGLVLHAGTTTEWLAPDVLAAPWWRVLQGAAPFQVPRGASAVRMGLGSGAEF